MEIPELLPQTQMVVPADPISVEMQHFIAQHVQSVEQLEIFCLLSDTPQKSWSVADVFRKIQSSEKSVSECLKKFAGEKLLIAESGGMYRLSPENESLAKELATAYRQRRVTIIELIYKTSATPIQDFAEAFRLKRKK